MKSPLTKLARFVSIYGARKAVFKAISRAEEVPRFVRYPPWPRRTRDIGIIGCGQFGFATVGHELSKAVGNRFGGCFDIDPHRTKRFSKFFGCRTFSSARELLEEPTLRLVYITSNHASHTGYAVEALNNGKSVYIEKPISVSIDQLTSLWAALAGSEGKYFFGYNRPFSTACRLLRAWADVDWQEPLTLSCYVVGHKIHDDHWYRKPEEGTRVCGNLGHWLDLLVHLRSWGRLEDRWRISIAYSDDRVSDDNLAITLVSSRGSLATITLTSRSEPFEGINEQINIQLGDLTAQIDDFRSVAFRQEERFLKRRFPFKDVGHRGAIGQPFPGADKRNALEAIASSLLMLKVKDMVLNRETDLEFSFSEAWSACLGPVPTGLPLQ